MYFVSRDKYKNVIIILFISIILGADEKNKNKFYIPIILYLHTYRYKSRPPLSIHMQYYFVTNFGLIPNRHKHNAVHINYVDNINLKSFRVYGINLL